MGKDKANAPYEFGCKMSIATPVARPKGGHASLSGTCSLTNYQRLPKRLRHPPPPPPLISLRRMINGKLCYLWRAVDHEGEVLETVVTAKRDKAAALKFLKRIMKKYGRPRSVVTDGLSSYPAAMSEIGNVDRHEVGRRLNNRAENSHQPFRRRERAMQRFRSAKTLQKFSSVHAQVHNHFNQERHLVAREIYKQRRLDALAKWRALAA